MPTVTCKKGNMIMPYDNFGNYVPYQLYPQRQPQNIYAFVNGLEGAKSYNVPANQTILLMDSDQPVCYMKTSNALGQATLRYFKLTEVGENDVRTPTTPVQNNTSTYVTKNEFDELVKRLERLEPKED